MASLVQSLAAGDKVAAISDATKDLHSAISKLEKVSLLPICATEACCSSRHPVCVRCTMQRPLHLGMMTGCG